MVMDWYGFLRMHKDKDANLDLISRMIGVGQPYMHIIGIFQGGKLIGIKGYDPWLKDIRRMYNQMQFHKTESN